METKDLFALRDTDQQQMIYRDLTCPTCVEWLIPTYLGIYKQPYSYLSAESARLGHPRQYPGVPLRHRLRALPAEQSSFSLISCSAILFCFCSFCQLSLDFSVASCKFGFSAHTILNLFAIFSSFLYRKLNFLPVAANLPPVHYLRNGPALVFL